MPPRKSKARLGDLVYDQHIYPRVHVDPGHWAEMVRAMEAGISLPPPLIDRPSMRIVDGVHRWFALTKMFVPDHRIEVEFRTFASELEMIEEAARLLPKGRKADTQDYIRVSLLLEQHGRSPEEIAVVLSTTTKRVEELLLRVVIEPSGDRAPAKPIVYPPRGAAPRQLTSNEQVEVLRSSGGLRVAQAAGQLRREIESGLVSMESQATRAALWQLHDVIAATVPRP